MMQTGPSNLGFWVINKILPTRKSAELRGSPPFLLYGQVAQEILEDESGIQSMSIVDRNSMLKLLCRPKKQEIEAADEINQSIWDVRVCQVGVRITPWPRSTQPIE